MGIIGLSLSGRSTLFNALTRGEGGGGLRVGVVQVPDPRLRELEVLLHPKKTIPAELRFIDVETPPRRGLGILPDPLRQTDAFALVVRDFVDETIPHPEGSLDPHRDLSTVEMELVLSDLEFIERKLKKIDSLITKSKASERQSLSQERELLLRLKTALEKNIPIREQLLSAKERQLLQGYTLLSIKPMLVVVNIGEDKLSQLPQLETEWQKICRPYREAIVLCAKLERELSQLSPEEAKEFRQAMGLSASIIDRLISQCYHLLGLVSFFTVVSAELKAWSVPQDTPAIKAAGRIHSDMEKGFIRAEVIAFDDLVEAGGFAQARHQGVLRYEGKNYLVQDGDIVTFLFNV